MGICQSNTTKEEEDGLTIQDEHTKDKETVVTLQHEDLQVKHSNPTKSEDKKNKFKRKTSAHQGIMSAIAMRFPHVRRSFNTLYSFYYRPIISF